MMKKIFFGEYRNISSAALILGIFSIASRLIGVVRDRIFAAKFGAGDVLDAYYAAFRIPDLLFNLFVLGALSAGFIPVFLEYVVFKKDRGTEEKSRQQAWELVNGVANVLILSLALISICVAFFSPLIVPIITPGFSSEKINDVVFLTRIMFLSPVLLGLGSLFGGVLQAFRKFFIYAMAPIFYNVGIIIGALYFYDIWGISGLAYGVILGALAQIFILIPPLFLEGYRPRPFTGFSHPGLRKIFRLMVPRTFTLAVYQASLFIVTIIASTLPSGSLAVFHLANDLQSFPVGILGVSLAMAAFPALSQHASEKDESTFLSLFSKSIRQMNFLLIPASVFFLILNDQIVRVILGAGNFSWDDTTRTSLTLGFFSVSIFAQGMNHLLVRGYYARKNTEIPFYIALFAMLLNIPASILFSRYMGVPGLGLAFSLSSVVQCFVLYAYFVKLFPMTPRTEIRKSFFKIMILTLIMGVVMQLVKNSLGSYLDFRTFIGIFVHGFVSAVAGISVYAVLAILIRLEEMQWFLRSMRKKIYTMAKLLLPSLEIPVADHIS